MKFEIITLFPDYFSLSLSQSLLGKAVNKELIELNIVDLRDFAVDKHNTVDDAPYGGGGGMVLKIEPLDNCLKSLGYKHKHQNDSAVSSDEAVKNDKIILTSAAGKSFDHNQAIKYSLTNKITIICGHYLGVDERIIDLYDIEEISIGDYILTGGEPAAAVMVDAVARLIPKVLGNFQSALGDSYMDDIVGTPCYTRPEEYESRKVPPELLGGDHKKIMKFRRQSALKKCSQNRPDLLKKAELSTDELKMLNLHIN